MKRKGSVESKRNRRNRRKAKRFLTKDLSGLARHTATTHPKEEIREAAKEYLKRFRV